MIEFAQSRDLPFVRVTEEETLDMWAPSRPADAEAAINLGKSYAVALQKMMEANGRYVTYANVMRAMITKGHWGPVERGFCTVFGIFAIGLRPVDVEPPVKSNVVPIQRAAA